MEAVVSNFGLQAAAAEIFLLSAICVILLVDVFLNDRQRWITYALSLLTLAGVAFVTVDFAVESRVSAFEGMFIADPMGDVLKLFSYGTVAVSLLYSREYLQRNGLFRGEYFVLALVALLGVMVMTSAGNLLTVYLGVELLSLSLYAMVAFDRDSGVAAESAMKYFVLGAIASGTLLYGFSILYGVTGTLQLDELAVAVREVGPFREDLFFRLNVVPLRLPPLRERTEDIPDLIRHFFTQAAREGLPAKQIDQAGQERLKRHRWPGNVRELENLARRLAALYPQETITAAVIESELAQPALPAGGDEPRGEESLSGAVERHLTAYFSGFDDGLPPAGLYHRILREIEYPLLTAALAATRGNQIRAADLLGVNRNTLRKKIRDLDIQVFRGGN